MNIVGSDQEYQIKKVQLGEDLLQILPAWRRCNAKFNDSIIFQDPEWLTEFYKERSKDLHIFLFQKNNEIIGVVPFLLGQWPLKCQIGELTLARIPLRRFRLQGNYLNIPDNPAAYDLLFNSLLASTSTFDAIHLESLRVDSFLWKYLNSSSLVNRSFRVYISEAPSPHPLIQMVGSFDDYMHKFSSKTRNTCFRKVKKLREQGEVQLIRVTEAQEVDAFVDSVTELSKKTYQYNLLGLGVRKPDLFKQTLKIIADHGWLRSYVLTCQQVACSFMIGYQDSQRFYYIDVGYDPGWSKFSVGTVLQLLVLEDLFDYRTPRIFDFGSYGEHKQFFANDSYMEASVYLFPRRAYTRFAQSIHHACLLTSKGITATLDRFHLKRKIKRLIRMLSVPGDSN